MHLYGSINTALTVTIHRSRRVKLDCPPVLDSPTSVADTAFERCRIQGQLDAGRTTIL